MWTFSTEAALRRVYNVTALLHLSRLIIRQVAAVAELVSECLEGIRR